MNGVRTRCVGILPGNYRVGIMPANRSVDIPACEPSHTRGEPRGLSGRGSKGARPLRQGPNGPGQPGTSSPRRTARSPNERGPSIVVSISRAENSAISPQIINIAKGIITTSPPCRERTSQRGVHPLRQHACYSDAKNIGNYCNWHGADDHEDFLPERHPQEKTGPHANGEEHGHHPQPAASPLNIELVFRLGKLNDVRQIAQRDGGDANGLQDVNAHNGGHALQFPAQGRGHEVRKRHHEKQEEDRRPRPFEGTPSAQNEHHANQERQQRIDVALVVQKQVEPANESEDREKRDPPPGAPGRPGIDHLLTVPEQKAGKNRHKEAVTIVGRRTPDPHHVDQRFPIGPEKSQQEDSPRRHHRRSGYPSFPLRQWWNRAYAHEFVSCSLANVSGDCCRPGGVPAASLVCKDVPAPAIEPHAVLRNFFSGLELRRIVRLPMADANGRDFSQKC